MGSRHGVTVKKEVAANLKYVSIVLWAVGLSFLPQALFRAENGGRAVWSAKTGVLRSMGRSFKRPRDGVLGRSSRSSWA